MVREWGSASTLPLTLRIKPAQRSTQGPVLIIQPISLCYTCAAVVFTLLEGIVTTQKCTVNARESQKRSGGGGSNSNLPHGSSRNWTPKDHQMRTLASMHTPPANPHMQDTGHSPTAHTASPTQGPHPTHEPGFFSSVCSPSAVLYSLGTSGSITTQVSIPHPPVNTLQTQATPGHTA